MTLLNTIGPLLEVDDLRVMRGGIEVVHGVKLRVFTGTIATIVGRSGSGKSATLQAIARLLPGKGTVAFGGRRMDLLRSERVVRWGLVYVPQDRGLIGSLTVRENLQLGAFARRDRYAIINDAATTLDRFPDLGRRASVRACELTAWESALLSLGRALMAKPRMLLLDEPTAGLPPEGVAEMFAIIGQLSDQGMPILLAEQYERKATAISDYVYAMDRGTIVKEGVSRVMAFEPEVEAAHFGAAAP
ncbi:MAG TPA: ATP-binding cassette domain-containing protein [Candidatus Eremiobacteraceae bacterium]|nr:ATP-binding cassette domain-containing protein [Candidatus Eremiobacteraceae bacterium]